MSERRVGDFLRSKPRESFVLSTKVGRLLNAPANAKEFRSETFWTSALPFEWHFDYGRDAVLRSFDDSLQRLGLNRVDLLLVHDLEPRSDWDAQAFAARLGEFGSGGGFAALEELRSDKSISGIGAGINQAESVTALLGRFDLDVVLLAGRYTLLNQDALEVALPTCQERDVGMVVGGVFNSGILATGAGEGAKFAYQPATPEIIDRVRQLERVCRDHRVDLASAALQFPLAHPAVVSVIPGAAHPGEVRQNVEGVSSSISGQFWRDLSERGLLRSDAPLPGEASS
jgi:D-threo-aldose 1-dehydrogenase